MDSQVNMSSLNLTTALESSGIMRVNRAGTEWLGQVIGHGRHYGIIQTNYIYQCKRY